MPRAERCALHCDYVSWRKPVRVDWQCFRNLFACLSRNKCKVGAPRRGFIYCNASRADRAAALMGGPFDRCRQFMVDGDNFVVSRHSLVSGTGNGMFNQLRGVCIIA